MTAALILADSAESAKSGRTPVGDLDGASAIKRLILVFQRAGIKKIAVVTGHDAENLEKHCAHMGVVFLRNEIYEEEDTLRSVKTGLDYLKGKCSGTFISPAHIPLFSASTLESMESTNSPIVIPIYNNEPGYPVLISDNMFYKFFGYDGQGGLQGFLSSVSADCRNIEVSDQGILVDMRKRANVSGLIEKQGLRKVKPDAKIQLSAEKGFFGPGTLLLLNLTRETGSLKQAAQQMGVSYSKALKMVAVVEKQLGFRILESRQGGSGGGSSIVTKKGLDLMSRYDAFASECGDFINKAFERHFKHFM